MKPMTFGDCGVRFTPQPHSYHLASDGRELMGVTGLIKHTLGLGYSDDDLSDPSRAFFIERAGEYGHAVHAAIQSLEEEDWPVMVYPKSEKFRKDADDCFWDVRHETQGYMTLRKGFTPVANELVVTDGERYASCIDNIWQKDATGGLWLADTKTNNLRYYPGGEAALREYLSWQLSCYAWMLERQYPGLKVEGLLANWLRGDEHRQWVIDRKADEDVARLLRTPWARDEVTGKVIYFCEHLPAQKAVSVSETQAQIVPAHVIEEIAATFRTMEQARRRHDELKTALEKAMRASNVKKWETGAFTATLTAETASLTFDSKRFAAEHPDLWELYRKPTARKGGLRITLRD